MAYPKKFLLQFLKALERTKENPDLGEAICDNMDHYFFSKEYRLTKVVLRADLFKLWPKFSGQPSFPVPHNSATPWDAFWKCERNEQEAFWDRSTQYGRDRWELLDFMIEEVKHMIEFIDEQEEQE